MLSWLIEKVIISYIYSTCTYLLLYLGFKSIRKKSDTFLNLSNLIVFVGLAVNLIFVALNSITCSIEHVESLKKVETEGYELYYTKNCFTFLIWTLILAFLIQTPFLFKRYRQKIVMTIISITALVIIQNLERVINFITSFYREYLPSSWVFYNDNLDTLWTICSSIFYFTICWKIPHFRKSNMTDKLA